MMHIQEFDYVKEYYLPSNTTPNGYIVYYNMALKILYTS